MQNCACFRFYAELNDFLPSAKRKVDFTYYFQGTPSIKDAIEALGIPHTEVDLILINGKSVDFNYLLQNGDRVSVYPVFETLNITSATHLRTKPLRQTRFILDVHLGRLAKYLRMLGFDTFYQNNYDDNAIIALSLKENRIILTRDIGLLKNKVVTHGYWLRSTIPTKQLNEIINYFDLAAELAPFKRCLVCNGELNPIAKETIAAVLLPKTKAHFTEFYICNHCSKIYWHGSHYNNMQKFLTHLLK